MLPTPHQQSQGTGRVSSVNQRDPRNAFATPEPRGKGVEKKNSKINNSNTDVRKLGQENLLARSLSF